MSVSDHLFNAIGPALKTAKVWAPLTDRQKIAEAIEDHLRQHDVILVDATAPPRWEALYEPGNVSSHFIGYLNDEASAKGAAEAWMRSQMLEQPGLLRWDEFRMDPDRFGYDVEYRLREIDEDGTETESGLLVQHRAGHSGEASR